MNKNRSGERPAIDLVEEAVHLLRSAPIAAWAWYLIGVIPFLLALLYFWTDMSWSAEARSACAIEAAGVGIAFVWMEWMQALFARALRRHLRLGAATRLRPRELWLFLVSQATIQPSKLFILPIAAIATLPFGWVHAFYESVTANFAGEENFRQLWSKAWRQARLWPRQNHFALTLTVLFYLLMSANIFILVLILPHLLKMFTGAENIFTLSGVSALNSTTLAVVAAATYLCCAPLTKAIHVLRCFYGESLHSGEDLQIEFRRATKLLTAATLALLAMTAPLSAATNSEKPRISAENLNRSIEETISEPQFRWRRPRSDQTESAARKPTWIERFVKNTFHKIAEWIRAIERWIDKHWRQPSPKLDTDRAGGDTSAKSILKIILVILASALVVMLGWSIRNYIVRTRAESAAAPLPRKIDSLDENVTADLLPEDDWLRLARESITNGDLRAGLRALFLAALAHLAQREVIALARHKSNRDYHAELRRRTPEQSQLHEAFSENMRDLERVWYGRHAAGAAHVHRAEENLALIRNP